ncbi:LamG-like jellyroll fold domain-containing protein [Microbacterium sp. ASV81]|uniref:LamG-like jellyroll fold domain-containing protein n=1 Tax=Microbacterium capsulatum TaxID=3041921 RepID=A0ABU0XF37_9MICO|nr:LamG-like jellyroll fold domain-containing protein [Microbacterium sp. ASV81]MDQ4213728.1 LamG-like jellyroll fold domain-containing protein [Microbacterium sp. ASV81]
MRAFRAFTGGFVVAALIVGGASPAASATTNYQATASRQAATVGATASASARAAATGEPVVVDALTTPTSLTKALPGGAMQLELSSRPVRVQQGGGWVPVNLTLQRDGDWFSPAASAVPVRFSPGGTNVISQTQTSSGEWVSESWPLGALPQPTIDGDTATYAEVAPGVDLKLVATKTGMASIYVVKSEEAAKSSGLAKLQVAVAGADLTTPDTGRVQAKAADGSSLIAAQPLWWDSSHGGTFKEPGSEAPPTPVTHEIAPDLLTMDVGASVAKAEVPAKAPVQYPIFVDPDWSTGMTASWYTDAAYPDASYLTAGASDVLRVGSYGQYVSDMFFQFPLGALAGKHILSAGVGTTQLSVDACGVGPITSHFVSVFSPGYTWNQEQYLRQSGQMWWSWAMGSWVGPDCGSAPMYVGWTVTDAVQSQAGQPNIHFAFAPGSSQSRRHYSRDATLVVSYNSYPDTPTNPSIVSPSRTCGTATAPAYVGASNVTVQVTQTDPDPGNVDDNFDLFLASNLNQRVQWQHPGMVAQGPRTVTFTGLSDGQTYAWRARGSDWLDDGIGSTDLCYFTVDTTKPGVPTATTAATSFTVGSGLNVSLSGAADVVGFVYWVTPTQLTSPAPNVPVDGTVSTASALPDCNGRVTANVRWACGNGSTAVTVSVAPTDALSTLWVSAYDRAGNQSAARGLPLYTSIGTPAAEANIDAGHMWQVSSLWSPLPSVVPDSNPWIGANGIDLNLPSGASVNSTDTVIPPLSGPVMKTGPLPNANEYIYASTAPVNATNSFTWSMWIKTDYVPSQGQDQVVAGQYAAAGGRGEVKLLATQDNHYAFCITGAPAADDNGRPVSNCVKGGSLAIGTWQLVTGIWDAANQQLRLLIGNSTVPVAVAGHVLGSGDWSAQGQLALGPSPDTHRFSGYIADPAFLPGVIDYYQLARLADQQLPFSS